MNRGIESESDAARVLAGAVRLLIGTTPGAQTPIPQILLQVEGASDWLRWQHRLFLEYWAEGALLEGRERLEGVECYRVVSRRRAWPRAPRRTCRFWVDAESFRLRQLESWEDGDALGWFCREVFTDESLGAAIDPAAFQVPTGSPRPGAHRPAPISSTS